MGRTTSRGRPAIVGVVAVAVLAGLAGPGHAEAATADITIASPKSGATLTGAQVWKATARRPSVISRVTFRIDGKLVWTQGTIPYAYKDGRLNTRTLANGTHTLKVTAFERGGGRGSASTRVIVKNRPDTKAPSAPRDLAVVGATRSAVTVAWKASTDLVGVASYRVHLNGRTAGNTRDTRRTLGGLACGTRYRVAVSAVDAAGNRSARNSLPASTLACAPPRPPSAPAPPPPSGPGPPIVAASVFVSPSGSDSAGCSVGAPCASLGRAYRVADPGDVVEVAAGSYPSQTIALDPGKTSGTDVVVRPAPGASVSVSYLSVYGRHLEIRDIATSGWYIRPGSSDVTFRGVVSDGSTFITSADQVRLIGGEIRDVDSADGLQVKRATSGYAEPTDLLIDGLYIHDITRTGDPSSHVECVQFTAARNVVIRNSRFNHCGTQGVFFKEGLGGQIDDVLLENNWFGTLSGYNTLIFDDGVSDMTARYNSFAQSPRLGGGAGTSGLTAYGNIGTLTSCGTGVGYHHNVWSGVSCGAGDVTAAPGFVNQSAFDLRLAPGSAGIDRGDPSSHPSTDIAGTARPLGGAPDAGAHELA